MADNVYKLKFKLSDNTEIDAGNITVPQGEKGDKGDPGTVVYSASTPLMDGTASTGTASAAARGDHRHPTDTSRQEKLVSGTTIKTINGQSILGSGDIAVSGGATSKNLDDILTVVSSTTLAEICNAIINDNCTSAYCYQENVYEPVTASYVGTLLYNAGMEFFNGPPDAGFVFTKLVQSDTYRVIQVTRTIGEAYPNYNDYNVGSLVSYDGTTWYAQGCASNRLGSLTTYSQNKSVSSGSTVTFDNIVKTIDPNKSYLVVCSIVNSSYDAGTVSVENTIKARISAIGPYPWYQLCKGEISPNFSVTNVAFIRGSEINSNGGYSIFIEASQSSGSSVLLTANVNIWEFNAL